ncbi:hypothetical protein Bca101_045004 [Brassica carinata]
MSPPSATADIPREVDPQIWRTCAGASVQIPSLYSRVYYFPQGHVEHSCPSSLISSFSSAPVPCIVSSVELLADLITDETLTMTADSPSGVTAWISSSLHSISTWNPLVQKLFITDIHCVVWDFRYIYHSTPRRHLLTTGWSKFINSKKLIAGDSMVFMRKSIDEMFIGVRRAPNSNHGGKYEYYGGGGGGAKKDFGKNGKGKLTAVAVFEAINKAVQGYPFEVVYYPIAEWSEFVVRDEDVEVYTIPWDEPEILQNLKRVNPWQVKIVANSSRLLATYPPARRLKYPHSTSGFLSGDGEIIYSGRGQLVVDPSPCLFSYTTFPAGMQGARHYEFGSFNSTGFIGESSLQLCTNNFFSPLPGLRNVKTEMMNYGSPPSDDLSPNRNTTNLSFKNEAAGNRGDAVRVNSIQLFGKIINVKEVSERGLAEFGLYEEDRSKESSDNEVVNETQLSLTYPQGM